MVCLFYILKLIVHPELKKSDNFGMAWGWRNDDKMFILAEFSFSFSFSICALFEHGWFIITNSVSHAADTSSLRTSCCSFAEAIKISICEMKHGGSFRGCFAAETRPPEKLSCETERGTRLTPCPPRVVLHYRYMAGVFPLHYCSFLRLHDIKKAKIKLLEW